MRGARVGVRVRSRRGRGIRWFINGIRQALREEKAFFNAMLWYESVDLSTRYKNRTDDQAVEISVFSDTCGNHNNYTRDYHAEKVQRRHCASRHGNYGFQALKKGNDLCKIRHAAA
jgi:hypothetical protein